MIKSFLDENTKELYITGKNKKIATNIHKVAIRKLDYLNSAVDINDLRVPPSNHLERLKGSLEGFYSIRVNIKYRIIFKFIKGDAYNVSIVDYH